MRISTRHSFSSIMRMALLVTLLGYVVSNTSASSTAGLDRPVRRASPDSKMIAITFDDGPDPHSTMDIVNVLERHSAHATFFMIGKLVDERPDLAKAVSSAGHQIGAHTYFHSRVSQLST